MGITLEAGVSLGARPIFEFGSESQQQQYLPDLVAGRALAGFGLTEPAGGSDAGDTRTRAVLDRSAGTPEWVINGAKTFITNSGTDITSHVTVTAGIDDGVSSIIVPSGTPGFVVEPAYRKMGWHASDTHGLVFDDCRVPEANLLGAPGRGFHQFLASLDDGRIAIAALAVGLIQACLDECTAYANQRQAFGRPISSYQAIAFKCADLAVGRGNRPAGDLRRSSPQRTQDCHSRSKRPSPSSTPPRLLCPPPERRPRSSAATDSWTKPRYRVSIGTPRSWRSARAPARSSGWSSPASSAWLLPRSGTPATPTYLAVSARTEILRRTRR